MFKACRRKLTLSTQSKIAVNLFSINVINTKRNEESGGGGKQNS
jgi:hypothetical protein